MVRLLLVDDHIVVREGFKQLFALTDDIVVIAEAANGAQTLDALRRERFDLVLLDMNLPGVSGTDLIAQIVAHDDAPPILILSMNNEPQVVRRALAAGACGFVSKDNDSETLLSAIRKITVGGRFLTPSLAEALAFHSSAPDNLRPLHEQLSNRELQIFLLLSKGHGGNNIAHQLAISNRTVSTHKARLMEKMGFTCNADLVKYALWRQLTD